jgi:hypothetical protein
MKILILGAQRRLPFICEEEQPQEDNRLGKEMAEIVLSLPFPLYSGKRVEVLHAPVWLGSPSPVSSAVVIGLSFAVVG